MDFSQAQLLGSDNAFIRFFLEDSNDTRTEEELRLATANRHCGCTYHFDNQVTRVGKILAIVPVDQREAFKKLARRLRTADSYKEFQQRACTLTAQFPRAKRWVDWWTQRHIANLLILNRSKDSKDSRVLLPETTNAQEAAHFSMYSRQGKKHELITGLKKCYKIAIEHEKTWYHVKGML